jgi:Fe2+ or Zn2+ uptake regulation protein
LALFDLKVMEEVSAAEVARTILDYLQRNPEAQDTLEGIVQWWLPEQHRNPPTATIKEALDKLVAAGLISEHKGQDGRVSYRVTR